MRLLVAFCALAALAGETTLSTPSREADRVLKKIHSTRGFGQVRRFATLQFDRTTDNVIYSELKKSAKRVDPKHRDCNAVKSPNNQMGDNLDLMILTGLICAEAAKPGSLRFKE